jgi:hypothetical protein
MTPKNMAESPKRFFFFQSPENSIEIGRQPKTSLHKMVAFTYLTLQEHKKASFLEARL